MTEEQMANIVIEKLDPITKSFIRNTSEDDLISFHPDLGRDIRNYFNLWANKWQPETEDGIDFSPNHPDAVSQRVIELIHKKLSCQKAKISV